MSRAPVTAKPVEPMPEWLRLAAPTARLHVKDLAELFGYAKPVGLYHSITAGDFPKADGFSHEYYRFGGQTRMWWRKTTIVREYRRRIALQNNS